MKGKGWFKCFGENEKARRREREDLREGEKEARGREKGVRRGRKGVERDMDRKEETR